MDSRPPLLSVQTAYRIVRKGNPTTALVRDNNTPVPVNIPKGQVLIKVQAVSLNPMYAFFNHIDLKQMTFCANIRPLTVATS